MNSIHPEVLQLAEPHQESFSLQLSKTLHTRHQATDLPQKLQAIPEKSPDLMGVILKEGKV